MKNNNQQTDSLFGTSAFFKASDVIIYPNIDMGGGAFAHGQLYVALSRLTSIDGLILRRTITDKDVIVSDTVKKFMEK